MYFLLIAESLSYIMTSLKKINFFLLNILAYFINLKNTIFAVYILNKCKNKIIIFAHNCRGKKMERTQKLSFKSEKKIQRNGFN